MFINQKLIVDYHYESEKKTIANLVHVADVDQSNTGCVNPVYLLCFPFWAQFNVFICSHVTSQTLYNAREMIQFASSVFMYCLILNQI